MLRKTILVGKTKYDGPKTFPAIVRQIKKDLKYDVREEFIRDVIKIAFSAVCLGKVMDQKEKFYLSKIGRFFMKLKTRKEKIEKKNKKAFRTPQGKKNQNKYINNWHKREKIRKNWAALNERRALSGMKPLSLANYIKFKHPTIKNRTFFLK